MSHKIFLAWLLVLLFLVSPASSPSPVQARPSAVFTVNDTTDATDANPGDGICETAPGNGVCTLRAAIQETNALPGMDITILPSGIYTLTIPGANEDNAATGDLDIKDDLLLVGMGTDQTIVDGNGLDRVFDIFAPANVTLGGLTVRGGYESSYNTGGGGIRNAAQLNINNSTIFSNTDGYYGGGIYNRDALVMDNVTIASNIANPSYPNSYGNGGGIYNSGGTIRIDHSLIVSNTAYTYGAGIYNLSGSLTMNHSQVLSNTFSNSQGGIGGGIASRNDTPVKPMTWLTDVIVSGNSARFIAGVLSNGVMTATNSHFDNNIGPGPEGFAAGLANGNEGSMTLSEVTVNNNLAANWSGLANGFGVMTMTNSTIANNYANGEVAGFITGGTAVMDHITVTGNSAHVYAGFLNVGILTLTNSVVRDNHALSNGSGFLSDAEYGIPVYNPDRNALGLLRSFFEAPNQPPYPGIANLDHVTITNNTAEGSYAGFGNGGTATINSVLILSNTTNNSAGLFNSRLLTVTNSAIFSNTAVYSGGGIVNSTYPPNTPRPSNALFINVTVSGNQAIGGYGGGILATIYPGSPYSSSTSLLNVTLSNNTALTGSNIAILTSTIWATNTIIANGVSSDNCYFSSGTLTSFGHNLEDTNSCGLNATGDLTNTNPLLGPLQDNGGNTLTHALLFGSPAIDAGDNNGCPRTDQRGWLRPFGRACDIGAFELHYPFWLPLLLFTAR